MKSVAAHKASVAATKAAVASALEAHNKVIAHVAANSMHHL